MTEKELIALALERGGSISPSLGEAIASCRLDGETQLVWPSPPPDISEEEFQGMVFAYAETMGWKGYHTYNSRRSPEGFPDLVLVSAARKREVKAELKTETGKESNAQREWRMEFEKAGSEVYLWRPSDWPKILEILA